MLVPCFGNVKVLCKRREREREYTTLLLSVGDFVFIKVYLGGERSEYSKTFY